MKTFNKETAILLIIFNRAGTTQQVFKQIRSVKPKRLYVAADGPRNKHNYVECEKARSVLSYIDWDCQLFKLYQKENLGCDTHCYNAISWFFEQESEGIVLEDDCVPSISFFAFCSTLLEKYRNDERIGHITGGNYQFGIKRGEGSYYFSNLTYVGGWAGWRRVWKNIQLNNNNYDVFNKLDYLHYLPSHAPFYSHWSKYFHLANHRTDMCWDFRYAYNNLINNRLSINPNSNLITNIGCYNKATHYIENYPFADIKNEEIENIIHPDFVLPDIEADMYSQIKEHNSSCALLSQDNDTFYLKKKINKIVEECDISLQIPKIIHQIYVDLEEPLSYLKEPPSYLKKLSLSWKEMNPSWEYKFWNKDDIDLFLNKYYPELIDIYQSFPYDVQRLDAIRYLILYKMGGLYVDMDYECTESICPVLLDVQCAMGLEPKGNAIRRRMPYIVGNAFMATIPGHPFFKEIVNTVFYNKDEHFYLNKSILETTGPYMTTKVYNNSEDKENVDLIPAEFVTPLTHDEVMKVIDGKVSKQIENKIEKSYAIHYFFGSWYK